MICTSTLEFCFEHSLPAIFSHLATMETTVDINFFFMKVDRILSVVCVDGIFIEL